MNKKKLKEYQHKVKIEKLEELLSLKKNYIKNLN